jgi:hypothetical protein
MALKRTLTKQIERMGLIDPAQDVHIHVPDADPAAELIRGSEAFTNTVAALVRERNELKQKNEWLMRELIVERQTNKRVAEERDYWRKFAMEQVRANGKLSAIIDNAQLMFSSCGKVLEEVKALSDALDPAPAVEAPQEIPQSFDQNGIPVNTGSPTAISLQEILTMTEAL